MKSGLGGPMTLGNAAAGRVRLIVWCLDCHHQVEICGHGQYLLHDLRGRAK